MIQTFPKHPEADDVYYIDGAWAPAAITATDKRFTDAELTAEYWALNYFLAGAQFNEVSSGAPYSETFWERNYEKSNALYRFAALPHYDEEAS